MFDGDDVKKTDDPFESIWNDQKNEQVLEYKHESVRNLAMFGFSRSQIDKAWNAMQQSDQKKIKPDDGPLFVQTMLDFLYKEQKKL